jgi:hypothetical protein
MRKQNQQYKQKGIRQYNQTERQECGKPVTAVQIEDKEMIPASTAIDAHAQHFEATDKLVLPILKAFAKYTR